MRCFAQRHFSRAAAFLLETLIPHLSSPAESSWRENPRQRWPGVRFLLVSFSFPFFSSLQTAAKSAGHPENPHERHRQQRSGGSWVVLHKQLHLEAILTINQRLEAPEEKRKKKTQHKTFVVGSQTRKTSSKSVNYGCWLLEALTWFHTATKLKPEPTKGWRNDVVSAISYRKLSQWFSPNPNKSFPQP